MSIDYLYVIAVAAALFMVLPIVIQTVKWSRGERRRRKHASRRGGDISEAIRRDACFWDDDPDPWQWI